MTFLARCLGGPVDNLPEAQAGRGFRPLLVIPGIKQLKRDAGEIPGVACDEDQFVAQCNGRDPGVHHRKPPSFPLRSGHKAAPGECGLAIDCQQPIAEAGGKLDIQPLLQRRLPAPLLELRYPLGNFTDTGDAQEGSVLVDLIEPGQHPRLWTRALHFGQDIGIEQVVHSGRSRPESPSRSRAIMERASSYAKTAIVLD